MAKLVGKVRVALGLVVAGAVATSVAVVGCGGDDTGAANDAGNDHTSGSSSGSSSSSGAGSSSGSSSSSGAGSSSSSGGTGDGGKADADAGGGGGADADATLSTPDADAGGGSDADAGLAACNTAAALLANGGTLLFSFDDGGIAGWGINQPVTDPADAGLSATAAVGNLTVGNSCPGSIQVTVPFSTVGQKAQLANAIPGAGTPVTGTTLHMSIKVLVPANTDGSAGPYNTLAGPAFSGNVQPYFQGEFAQADGDIPRDDAGVPITYQTGNFGVNTNWALFADGGWLTENISLQTPDGGPTTVYINQVGVIMYVPPVVPDGGPDPLPSPVTVQVYVDDVWVN